MKIAWLRVLFLILFLVFCFARNALVCMPSLPERCIEFPTWQENCAKFYAQNINPDELIEKLVTELDFDALDALKKFFINGINQQNFTNLLTPGFFILQNIVDHDALVTSMAWSPDCNWLAIAFWGGTVITYNVKTGEKKIFLNHEDLNCADYIFSMAWSPNCKYLACGHSGGNVILCNIKTGTSEVISIYRTGCEAFVYSMAWSPDGEQLAIGYSDGVIRICDVRIKECVFFAKQEGCVFSIAWSPDGKTLASASGDKSVRMWDIETGVGCNVFDHMCPAWSVAWSHDGKWLVGGYGDGKIEIMNFEKNEQASIAGHKDIVRSLLWSKDNKSLSSRSADGITKIWNIISMEGKIFIEFKGDARPVHWSTDGRFFVSNPYGTQTVTIWHKITNVDQLLLILVLQYLKKENRINELYEIINRDHLVSLMMAWFEFIPTEQTYLKKEFGINDRLLDDRLLVDCVIL